MEFQQKLRKQLITLRHGNPEEYPELLSMPDPYVDEVQAAINELIDQVLKAGIFEGTCLGSYKKVSIVHTDKLRIAFGINKEEEKSDE